MRKKSSSLSVIIVFLIIALVFYFYFPKPPYSIMSFDKRAVWISYQDLSSLDYSSKDAFKKDFQTILNNVDKYQNNTVIVHVRSFSDALYSSKLFPLSQVMTHQNQLSFDPLKEMVKMTHDKGMLFEAWINPYRVSFNQSTYQQFKNSSKGSWLNDKKLTIKYGTYDYILNPGSQIVRDYICDGVEEVVSNYDVDGIHFDDYFYVEGTHGSTSKNERLDNVNMLIQDVYHTIKNTDDDVTFGIAPQGNYENCINEGADIDTWLKEEGYVDYLMPQIYWTDQYGSNGKTKMFTDRSKLYARLERNSHVQLYAGLALYQAGKDLSTDQGWKSSSSNLSNQIQILSEKGYSGYCLFHYSSLMREAGQKEMDELLKTHP